MKTAEEIEKLVAKYSYGCSDENAHSAYFAYIEGYTQCQQDNAENQRERKLIHQLFIGKVCDEIGQEKTMALLKEAHEVITTLNKQ